MVPYNQYEGILEGEEVIQFDGSLEDLAALLVSSGVDISLWGMGEAKSLQDLYEELSSGETELSRLENGKLYRRVRVCGLEVFYVEGDNLLRLKEKYQMFKDGRRRERNLPCSLAEKVVAGESFLEAAGRGLKEELGLIIDPNRLSYQGVNIESRESKSYPGLNTRYVFAVFELFLNPNDYKPEYVEDDGKKITYFGWEKFV